MVDWIEEEIKLGLMQLVCIGFPWTPAPDLWEGTRMAWVAAVKHNRVWDQAMDGPRFRAAFLTMMAECTQWPTPKLFVESMPPRPQLKALPATPPDPERVQKLMDELAKELKL